MIERKLRIEVNARELTFGGVPLAESARAYLEMEARPGDPLPVVFGPVLEATHLVTYPDGTEAVVSRSVTRPDGTTETTDYRSDRN